VPSRHLLALREEGQWQNRLGDEFRRLLSQVIVSEKVPVWHLQRVETHAILLLITLLIGSNEP
jgi:hypothetical protein